MNNGDPVKFVYCTSAQYAQIQTKDPATIYFVYSSSDPSINIGSTEFGNVINSGLDTRVTALETWQASIADGDNLGYGA